MHRFAGDVSKFIRGKKNTTSNGSTYRGLTVYEKNMSNAIHELDYNFTFNQTEKIF